MKELRAQEILDFWFGQNPLAPEHLSDRLHLWFGAEDPPAVLAARDAAIVQRFGPLMDAAAYGELDSWAASPHRLLALILLLDQFPRHAYRGRARAFAQDHKAMMLAVNGLQTGADAALSAIQRLFFYLPLQHAETPAIQDESLAAYRRLVDDAPAEHREFFASSLRFAEQHQQVIARFGRFPHRNTALSRRSTPQELEYLHAGM